MKLTFLVTLAVCCGAARADGPTLTASFRVVGHLVPDSGNPLVYHYNFDARRNRSSIITYNYNVTETQERNLTIMDRGSSQFVHIASGSCKVEKSLPDLLEQWDKKLIDLQALASTAWGNDGVRNVSRGRPVRIFVQDVNGISVEIAWLDTDAGWGEVNHPYEITLSSNGKNSLRIFVMGFANGVNADEMEIPNGVYCEGYTNPQNQRRPNLATAGRTSLNFKAEIPPAQDGITPQWFEGYFSWQNHNLLSKIAFENSNSSDSQTVVYSMTHKQAFLLRPDIGPDDCTPVSIEKVKLPDKVDLVDPLAIHHVGNNFNFFEVFYGTVGNKMFFKKKDIVRGIPCDVYSLLRDDWPYKNAESTLWEWCFHIDASSAHIDYPVSLQIHWRRPNGSSINYAFYSTAQNDKGVTEIREFDIAACFDKNNSAQLVFSLNVSADATNDASAYLFSSEFLVDLRSEILEESGMPDKDYLRIQRTNVLAVTDAVFVEFTLLGKISPRDTGEDIAAVKATLQKSINSRDLVVEHQGLKLNAIPNSLVSRDEFLGKTADHTPSRNRSRRAVLDAQTMSSSGSMSLFAAYGFASLIFAVGCGVAIAEWYLRVHRRSSAVITAEVGLTQA